MWDGLKSTGSLSYCFALIEATAFSHPFFLNFNSEPTAASPHMGKMAQLVARALLITTVEDKDADIAQFQSSLK
jgi:hypothetical protein